MPNYASITKPLTDLTKKALPDKVTWTPECQSAFDTLKVKLLSKPVMKNPDFQKEFIIQTDASGFGVGAVLSQLDDNGEEHPIAYFSCKLLPKEQKYATVEKECLAIKLGIKAFEPYLLGKPFRVHTDHRALQWLDKARESNAHLTRRSLALQPYKFMVEHRTGTSNANADALPRIPAEVCCAQEGKEENVKGGPRGSKYKDSKAANQIQASHVSKVHVSSALYIRPEPPPALSSASTSCLEVPSPSSTATYQERAY